MVNEMNENELNEIAGGKAINGKYYNYVSNGWVPYQLKQGDFLSRLASARGTTVSMICTINPLIDNPNNVCAGYWILLPAAK